ncbi:MAG: DUF3105 domain-containing protein [Jatrophihabitantaceae bacterium]
MAQRKPPSAPAKKPGNRPSGATRPPAGRPAAGGRPPNRKPGKSIVNQKQTPWGTIITVAALVLFAAVIVVVAVVKTGGSKSDTGAWTKPEVAAAKQINGLVWKPHPNHQHVTTTVQYDGSPPFGGAHSPYWATCDGVVYKTQIANENAVHMLEHGTVWITYNPKTIKPGDLAILKAKVDAVDRMAMSPYNGLKTPISLQAWNYQLFVSSASDPRVDQFIEALRARKDSTPENAGCTGDGFKASQSYPGHPYNG